MPAPLGPVMKACVSASSRVRPTRHLPGVVDARRIADNTTQSAKVSHAHPIGAGDESMWSASSRVREPATCPASLMPAA